MKTSLLKMRGKNTHRAAFTLVELLTVIAIIGVLAALVITGIRTVRVNAYTAADLARLRSIGAGMALFVTDNDNRFPGNGTSQSGGRDTRWMSHVGRYMGLGNEISRTVTSTIDGTTKRTFLVLDNAFRRSEFHSAFTDPALYDINTAILESTGIFGGNVKYIFTNSTGFADYGISTSEVIFPGKTIIVGERYAGVLGEGANLGWTPSSTLDTTNVFPHANNGLASNAEIMRQGVRVARGPCSVLMADFSVQKVNIEDLNPGDMINKKTKGLRFIPQVD